MRIGYLASLLAVLCLTGSSGWADSIVQSQTVGLKDVGSLFAAPIGFAQFDSALGTLTAVTLCLQASLFGTVGIENVSNVPDVAFGIIAGSITVSDSDNSLTATDSPSASGPTHDLSAFDGTLDFAGTSGATDSVSGAPVATTATASALSLFSGNHQLFLTLTASTFPIAEGMERESADDTANVMAAAQLTYTYTPVPEPSTAALLTAAMAPFLWLGRRLFTRSVPSRLEERCGRFVE